MKIKKRIFNETFSEPLKLKNSYNKNPISLQRLMTNTPNTTISSNQLLTTKNELNFSETERFSKKNFNRKDNKKSTINKLLTEEQYMTPILIKLRKDYEERLKNEVKRDYPITEGKMMNHKLYKRKINEIEKYSKMKKKKKLNPILNITSEEYNRLKEIENKKYAVEFRNNFHKFLNYEIKEFDNIIKSNQANESKIIKNIFNGDIYFNEITLSKQLIDLNQQYQKEYDEIKSKRNNIETPAFINNLLKNKNILDTKMKIDLIRIKNEKKNKIKEKLRRTLLGLAAHLFRLKMTLNEFLIFEQENPNNDFSVCSKDFKKLIYAIKEQNLSLIDLLLIKNKYLIQMNDEFRQNPLHIAAKRNNPEIIKLLLEYGAKIDFEDFCGQTPLHISSKYNQIENVKILLLMLASPFKEDHQGNTADKLTTNILIKFFINKCKTITEINISRLNIKKSIIYIRNGLKFFFDMDEKQLKNLIY